MHDFNDFHDFKRLLRFTIWISIDLHHKILKDLKWFYGFYKISKDIMNFKNSLEINDYNTLFHNIFNTYSFIYFIFMRNKGEMEIERREGEGDIYI